MRNSPLFWVGIIVTAAAACEPKARPAATPVASVSNVLADTSRVQFASKEAVAKPTPVVDYEVLALAHTDSLRLFAPVLSQADTTVESEAFHKGDLNSDNLPDYLVLARSKRPCGEASEESYCRKVFIVLNGGAAGLRVVAANEGLVGCTDCGGAGVGDPFQQFTMEKGLFTVTQLYGACQKTELVSTFEYDPARHEWMLVARNTSDYSCQDASAKEVVRHEGPRQFGQVKFADASGL